MNKIELSRIEFRWLLAGIMLVPVTLFVIGLNVGLGLHSADEQSAVSVAQAEVLPIPRLDEQVITRVTAEDVAKLEAVVAEMSEQVVDTLVSEPVVDELLTQAEALTEASPDVLVEQLIETNQDQSIAAVEPLDEMYGVQVGSFGKLENAQGLKQSMIDRGYDAQLVNDGGRYRVVIATYTTKDEAKQAELAYETQHHADAYVTTVHQRDLVCCNTQYSHIRAPLLGQDKAHFEGNGVSFSRNVTPYWPKRGAPFGQAG